MYRRILVPLDRSRGAEAVLGIAAQVARADGAVLRLLHVAEEPVTLVARDRVLAYENQERERLEGEALDYLRDVARRLADVPTEVAVRFGEPGREIVDEARAAGADLVAMATHGRTGVAHLALGSVAEVVLRRAPCEVLVVRREEASHEEAPARAPGPAPAARGATCLVCGEPSGDRICDRCKARIRGEALEHKMEAEKAGRRRSPV